MRLSAFERCPTWLISSLSLLAQYRLLDLDLAQGIVSSAGKQSETLHRNYGVLRPYEYNLITPREIVGLIRAADDIPLSELCKKTRRMFLRKHLAQGFMTAEWLATQHPNRVRALFVGLASGKDFVPALSHAFGSNVGKIEREFREFVKQAY